MFCIFKDLIFMTTINQYQLSISNFNHFIFIDLDVYDEFKYIIRIGKQKKITFKINNSILNNHKVY